VSANMTEPYDQEDAISLVDLLLVFARHKWKIIVVPFLLGCITAAYSLILPEIYTASTTLIPSGRKQSTAVSMLSQLGPLAGMAGLELADTNAEVLITMLQSRRIQDVIINKHNHLKGKDLPMWKVRAKLADATTISLGRKDGIITVSVNDENPEKAAEMANHYVYELERLSRELVLTEASQRRAFVEQQLKDAQVKLQIAEEAMKISQETSGLIQLEEQGRAVIEAIATLQAQIASKEVELAALNLFATKENPDMKSASVAILEMRSQLDQLARENPGNSQARSSSIITTSQVPQAGLEHGRRLRDLKYAETINQLLTQQYQMAKIEEAQNAPILQVLDIAITPDQRSSPRRGRMVILAILVSLFCMVLTAFFLEEMHQGEKNTLQASKIADLKQNLWRI